MVQFYQSVTDEMYAALEAERDRRKLRNVQEVIRQILSDQLALIANATD